MMLGETQNALEEFKKAYEETGSALAAFNIGRMYYYGNGVEESDELAFPYLKAASENHIKDANVMLGAIYGFGTAVEKDDKMLVTLESIGIGVSDMNDLIRICIPQMVKEGFTEEQARALMKNNLPKLDYWQRYEQLSDDGEFEAFKKQLIEEINDLHIDGMPKVDKLNALVGSYVNLAYPLPSGKEVKFLNDVTTYLGNQLESEFGGERCFGILAGTDFILISTYEAEGKNPELVLYKNR